MHAVKVVPEAKKVERGLGESGKQEAEDCEHSGRWSDLPELAVELVIRNLVGTVASWQDRKVRKHSGGLGGRKQGKGLGIRALRGNRCRYIERLYNIALMKTGRGG